LSASFKAAVDAGVIPGQVDSGLDGPEAMRDIAGEGVKKESSGIAMVDW